MKTEAKVIADSISPDLIRLTTLQVCCPRFILAEVNTHRVFSRNWRSSRAVPVDKMIEEVRNHPFIPSQFTRNQAGMQGGEPLSGAELVHAEMVWREAAEVAAHYAERLAAVGVHKQYANRGLEPYLYVHGVISATEWDNFFKLRLHKDAQPEFQELAQQMAHAINQSTPVERKHYGTNSWHLPYITDFERSDHDLDYLMKMSASRCAWVSYKPFDESDAPNHVKVERTFNKLMSEPMHASPFEHVATPGSVHKSNFIGWDQWRHFLEEGRSHG